jgi:hypothetical protein
LRVPFATLICLLRVSGKRIVSLSRVNGASRRAGGRVGEIVAQRPLGSCADEQTHQRRSLTIE